jgi:hypothetical protein
MPVLDRDVQELLRRDGAATALRKVREVLDLGAQDARLFLGNFASHHPSFGIVRLWHPDVSPGQRSKG